MPVPDTNQTLPASRRLLRDDIYDRILSAILEGTLKPGERLHDEELQQWLGVSRTPIRQALERIVELGLVEMSPNRYTRVSLPDLNKLIGILEINVTLWSLSLEKTIPNLSDEQISKISEHKNTVVSMCENFDKGETSDLSHSLTRAILDYMNFFVEIADNEVLASTLRDMQPQLTYMLRATINVLKSSIIQECFISMYQYNTSRDAKRSTECLENLYKAIKFELENSTIFN